MISLELARKGSDRRVWLRLPAENEEVKAAFTQLDAPTDMTYIADSRSNIHDLNNYINNVDINNPEKFALLQQIAERTNGLSELKGKTFAGALYRIRQPPPPERAAAGRTGGRTKIFVVGVEMS